jgi:hypothetical protein
MCSVPGKTSRHRRPVSRDSTRPTWPVTTTWPALRCRGLLGGQTRRFSPDTPRDGGAGTARLTPSTQHSVTSVGVSSAESASAVHDIETCALGRSLVPPRPVHQLEPAVHPANAPPVKARQGIAGVEYPVRPMAAVISGTCTPNGPAEPSDPL